MTPETPESTQSDRAHTEQNLRAIGVMLLRIAAFVPQLPIWTGEAEYDAETDAPLDDPARLEAGLMLVHDEFLLPAVKALRQLVSLMHQHRDDRADTWWTVLDPVRTAQLSFPTPALAVVYGAVAEEVGQAFGVRVHAEPTQECGLLVTAVARRPDVTESRLNECLQALGTLWWPSQDEPT